MSIFVPLLLLLFMHIPGAHTSSRDVHDGYLHGAGGAKIFYRVIGSGTDTIVVVHGGPGAGMQSVQPAWEPLARTFVMIFYDQRGGGQSELPSDTSLLRADYFVGDLEAVRAHFELDEMNVLTHSFGSVLVARYARTYPNRIRRAVFHGATGPRRARAVARARAATSTASPDTALSRRASEVLRALLTGSASDPVEACREYEEIGKALALARGDTVIAMGTTCDAPPEAVRYYYLNTAQLAPRSFGDWDFTKDLDRMFAPLLVVYGANDTLDLADQREWADAVPNGRLLLVPDAGKSAVMDNPSFVLPAIEGFFRGVWPEPSE